MMEDLRDAQKTVSEFAKWIENLQPDNDLTKNGKRPELRNTRSGSDGSQKNMKTLSSSRWRPKNLKKEWDETMEGILWNELEQLQTRVARQFMVDQTALKEYISSREMMDLGSEFVRHYYDNLPREKAYWVAEDLFFNLQTVKHGDKDADIWEGAKVYKKGWDLADHLVRFVLLSEQFRICSGQDKWALWDWSFPLKVGFYLNVLRCYTTREAKQRQLAGDSAGPSASSVGKSSSGRNLSSSPAAKNEKKVDSQHGRRGTRST